MRIMVVIVKPGVLSNLNVSSFIQTGCEAPMVGFASPHTLLRRSWRDEEANSQMVECWQCEPQCTKQDHAAPHQYSKKND